MATLSEYAKEIINDSFWRWSKGEHITMFAGIVLGSILLGVLLIFGVAITFTAEAGLWTSGGLLAWLIFLIFFVSPFRVWQSTKHEVDELSSQLDERPDPIFEIVKHRKGKIRTSALRVTNRKYDAEFQVKLEFLGNFPRGMPPTPVSAQWLDEGVETKRHIQAGGNDSIIIFETETDAPREKENIFKWVQNGVAKLSISTAWLEILPQNTIPPEGEIKIYISCEPTMKEGSKVVHLGFIGDKISVLSGEVAIASS